MVLVAIGAGLVLWKSKIATHEAASTVVTEAEIQALVSGATPAQRKDLSENKEQRQTILKNFTEIFTMASAARKHGIGNDPLIAETIEYNNQEILARLYDQHVNEGKGPMPPFGFITEEEAKSFWAEPEGTGFFARLFSGATNRMREAEFDKYLENKLSYGVKSGRFAADTQPSEEDIKGLKDQYAKLMISYGRAVRQLEEIPTIKDPKVKKDWETFKTAVEFQQRLQAANLLAQAYTQEVVSKELAIKEADIDAYLKAHPDLTDVSKKKARGMEVLEKVKAGGDFAELAQEYSDDPGSKTRGGLYEGVAVGQFAPEFEAAIANLKPGEMAKELVQTPYGFHIIKLEKRGEAKGNDGVPKATYDVRHILISTMMKDPADPTGRELPVRMFVKSKLEKERQEEFMAKVKKENPVTIPADFKVEPPSEAEMKKLEEMQKQQIEQIKKMQEEQKKNPQAPAHSGGNAVPPPPQPPAPPKPAPPAAK